MTQHLTILTGASRGMGLAIAEALIAPDQQLVCIARHANAELQQRADAQGCRLAQWTLDLADATAASQRLERWLQQQPADAFGSASLINNAAIVPPPGPVESQGADTLAATVRVGLEAPLLLTAAFLRATAAWRAPRKVLNISSGLGRRAMAGSTAYCAVKAGMDHFSRAIALEQAQLPHGAKIVSLAPGVIDTDMQRELRSADPAQFPERERFVQLKAQGLLDSPAQAAAKVIAFLRRPDFGADPIGDVRG